MVRTPAKTDIYFLEVPDKLRLQVTHEQFTQLAIVNRDLRLERASTGELIVNPPTPWESGRRNLNLSTQFGTWCIQHEELGEGFDSSTAFTLPNGAIHSPDASWISQERCEVLTSEKKGFAQICPDFVVELRSSSDSLESLRDKMQEQVPRYYH